MQSDYVHYYLPTAALILSTYVVSRWLTAPTYKLKHIPTIGSSGIILSYIDAVRFLKHGHEMIQEGYEKYYGSAFKVSNIGRWVVMISGPQMLEDIRRATDEQISFEEAVAETLQTDYTMGRQINLDPYHIGIVRTPLTRNIGARFSDIRDEISAAFRDLVPVKGDEWTKFPALQTVMHVVCRTSNRFFVGLPLCEGAVWAPTTFSKLKILTILGRDPDYMKLNEQFTIDVVVRGQLINMFPAFLKPLVGRMITKVSVDTRKAVSHLGPQIRAHLNQDTKDWPSRPNNLISWLLDEAQGQQRTVEDISLRLLAINFAAIHTTSHALTHTLFYLAAYPEYAAPLREEIEAVIEAEGQWTKAAMGKMWKVDSFIKESQRLSVGGVALTRKILKDFTFSNGITVPAGTHVAFSGYATHIDEKNYSNPREFQGFRFLEQRDKEGEKIKHQIVSLSPDNLTFGTGRHACPGRFFAANELKAMVAHMVLNYDIKLPDDADVRPENIWFGANPIPNTTASVMFRKRKTN